MPAVTFAAAILPGQEEGWRRFVQEVWEMRSDEYEECRRRLGVRNESVWLARTAGGETALAYLEADDTERLVSTLAASAEPFDVWLRGRLAEFHGGDLARTPRRSATELIFSFEQAAGGGRRIKSEQNPPATRVAEGPSTAAAQRVSERGGAEARGRETPRRERPET